jgi:hypothetical protein
VTHSFALEPQNNDNRGDKTSEKAENGCQVQTSNFPCGVLGNFNPQHRIHLSEFSLFTDSARFHPPSYCRQQQSNHAREQRKCAKAGKIALSIALSARRPGIPPCK